jgi:acyl-CoA dehydrogenase
MDNNPAFNRIPPWVKAKLRPKAIDLIQRVFDWVETECVPAEPIMKAQLAKERWQTPPLMHELREKAKAAGLFNIFLPNHFKESPGLTNLEYACCAEIMGRCYWAAQVRLSLPVERILLIDADHELPRPRNWQHRTSCQVLFR